MTKPSTLKRKLLIEIADFPEDELKEVVDFVGYLKTKVKHVRSTEAVKLDPKKNPLRKLIGLVAHGALAKDIDRELYGGVYVMGAIKTIQCASDWGFYLTGFGV